MSTRKRSLRVFNNHFFGNKDEKDIDWLTAKITAKTFHARNEADIIYDILHNTTFPNEEYTTLLFQGVIDPSGVQSATDSLMDYLNIISYQIDNNIESVLNTAQARTFYYSPDYTQLKKSLKFKNKVNGEIRNLKIELANIENLLKEKKNFEKARTFQKRRTSRKSRFKSRKKKTTKVSRRNHRK